MLKMSKNTREDPQGRCARRVGRVGLEPPSILMFFFLSKNVDVFWVPELEITQAEDHVKPVLISFGKSQGVEEKEKNGWLPLHIAAASQASPEVVEALLRAHPKAEIANAHL